MTLAAPIPQRAARSLPRLFDAAGWPGQCAVCRGWCRGGLCAACIARFAAPCARCRRCALALPATAGGTCGACLRAPPPFEHAITAVDYGLPWRTLITRFKFHAGLELAPMLARRLADAATAALAADLPRPDCLLPAPLSDERQRERGFNQAWELARRVAARLRLPADAGLLLRLRDTAHQLALPLDRRAANVRGAFAVEPLRRAQLEGRCVALVDDVMTTGATAAEMARVLLQAGAAQVQVWTLARTPLRD